MKHLLTPPYERIAPFTPLFASVIMLAFPPSIEWMEFYLSRYLSFAALFLVWGAAVHLIERYRIATDAGSNDTPRRKNMALAGLVLAVLASLLLLNFIKIKFELPVFYLTLLLLGQQGLAHLAAQRGRDALRILCLFIYDTGIAFLSFQMAVFHWSWQPLIVGISFAALLAAIRIAAVLQRPLPSSGPPISPARRGRWSRAYSVALPLGLTGIVLLALLGHLSQIFVAPYLLLPLMPGLIARARAAPPLPEGAYSLVRRTAGVMGLFILILTACAALERSSRMGG